MQDLHFDVEIRFIFVGISVVRNGLSTNKKLFEYIG